VAPRQRADGGDNELTPREQEVAELIAAGLTNRQIAERLVLSGKTIERHVSNLFLKLGVTSRTSVAVAVARRREQDQPPRRRSRRA
jgi:DNA-binding NarL/FixJ family response regulator